MPKMLGLAEFHSRAKEGKRPRDAVRLMDVCAEMTTQEDSRVVRFVFSDDSVDRYGDTIDARGWQLDNYKANPVALFGHDAGSAENVIGRTVNVEIRGNQLVGDIEFMSGEVNPRAETVYQMVKAGYLSCVSVGFAPLEWKSAKDPKRPGGIDFKKQELLEISIVPIPANPNAVSLAKAAGLDTDSLGLIRDGFPVSKRGLYEVSWLAQLLGELGYLQGWVQDEADYEGDNSPVPQMIADAMKQIGEALIAMTAEEVSELLADPEKAAETPGQKAFAALKAMGKAAPPTEAERKVTEMTLHIDTSAAQKAIDELAAKLKAINDLQDPAPTIERAGKTISSVNEQILREAHDMAQQCCVKIKSIVEPEDGVEPQEQPNEPGVEERARKARAMKLRFDVQQRVTQ